MFYEDRRRIYVAVHSQQCLTRRASFVRLVTIEKWMNREQAHPQHLCTPGETAKAGSLASECFKF